MGSSALGQTPSAWVVFGVATLLALVASACSDGGLGVIGPASGGLVFVREEDGNAELMRARISDQRVVQITHTPEREERWPYWSSLADLVVFQVRPYGRSLMTDLRLWDPATGEDEAIAQTPRRDERWPAWSPVAPELAYSFKNARGPAGIAIYDTASHETRIVTRTAPREAFRRPEFAPDGRRLILERRTPTAVSHLWLLEPGSSPRILTEAPEFVDGKASFSPDEASLVFTRRLEENGPGDIVRLDLATGKVSHLAGLPEADDHSGKLSPLRDELVFVSDRDGSMDVFLVELPDGVARNLTPTPDLNESAPRWSPDGERLVILRWKELSAAAVERGELRPDPAQAEIAVIDRSGHVLFETTGTMADWMPAWP